MNKHVYLMAPLAVALLAAGCGSKPAAQQGSGNAEAPQAAAAPAEPPAPKLVRRKEASGLGAEQVNQALATKNASKTRTALVGKTVTLELAAGEGKTYDAADVDGLSVSCRATEAGFSGGEVTAKVQAFKAATKTRGASIELDNCASNFALVTAPAPVPAAKPATATATAAAPASTGKAKPGMDAQGNVVDSSKVEAGSGRTVKGINDYEGEITGNPAKNSKFTSLQIGMTIQQAINIVGQPSDAGSYMTGKAWIPFYYGGDRHRTEFAYKGQGRLIFAGGGGFVSYGNYGGGNLIWIIHNANDSGQR